MSDAVAADEGDFDTVQPTEADWRRRPAERCIESDLLELFECLKLIESASTDDPETWRCGHRIPHSFVRSLLADRYPASHWYNRQSMRTTSLPPKTSHVIICFAIASYR